MNPLMLFAAWEAGADGFKRPGPPPGPPPKLRFVCKNCSAEVSLDAARCGECDVVFWW